MSFRVYHRNDARLYDFQCRNLGPMKTLSLSDTLKLLPPKDGLRVEASIDYYETLRMAHIFNHTYHDPFSFNIDLDDLMSDYSHYVR